MSKTHRLTPEQWESIERYADDNSYDACFLELRDRIQALEAAQQLHTFTADEVAPIVVGAASADAQLAYSLLDRVAMAVCDAPNNHEGWRSEARAALREVAAWLREQSPEPGPIGKMLGQVSTPFQVMADMLCDEAIR